MEYRQWQSEDCRPTTSWCKDAKGQWKKYSNYSNPEKTYDFHHLVATKEALILQDRKQKCLVILEEKAAYCNRIKIATGEFSTAGPFPCSKWKGDDGSSVKFKFLKNDSHQYEWHRAYPISNTKYILKCTLSLIHEVQDSDSPVVILWNQNETPVILTNTQACFQVDGVNRKSRGKWIKSCNWSGEIVNHTVNNVVENSQLKTNFRKISPTEWERNQTGQREPDSYQHILDFESVSNLIIMTPTKDTPCTVVDNEHIYQGGTIIADGRWYGSAWNETSSESRAGMSVEVQEDDRCMFTFNSGNQSTSVKRRYVKVEAIQPGPTALIYGTNELCILEELIAKINGKIYADGCWDNTGRDNTDESNSALNQFNLVKIGNKGNISKCPSKRHYNQASELISRLEMSDVLRKTSQNLLMSTEVRIDMQGTNSSPNMKSHNIQVQTNTVPREDSKTIAHVSVPETATNIEEVKKALKMSLDEQTGYELQ